MPFKSKAQRRLFYVLERKGKLKKGTTRHWNEETGDRKLPERVADKTAADVSDHNLELGATTAAAQTIGRLRALPIGLLLKPTDPLTFQRAMDADAAKKLVEEFEKKHPG